MNPIQTSIAGSPASPETLREGQNYAQEVTREYNALPEKPKSRTETVKDFVVEGAKSLWRTFLDAPPWKKALMVAGAGATVYLGSKALKSFSEKLVSGFKSFFGIGQKAKEAVEQQASSTGFNLLKWTLGGALGAEAVTALYNVIQGKISFSEVFDAYKVGGLSGVGILLLKKQKEGTIQLGKDLYEKLSSSLGLPPLESVQQSLQNVKENVEQGYEWLDQKINFTGLKNKLAALFPNSNFSLPSLSAIAQELGIDASTESTFAEYTKYAGIAGAALLLYRYMGKKGLALNAALYFLFIKEGKESLGGELLGKLTHEFDSVRDSFLSNFSKNPDQRSWLEEALGSFSLEQNLDQLLEWAQEHSLEAMAAMNGLWICRGVIFTVLKKTLQGAGSAVKFATSSTTKAALTGLGIAAIYFGRREFTQDFIKAVYEDPESDAAKAMLGNLDTIFGIDRSKPETLSERQVPAFVKSILEDPVEALRLDKTVQAAFKDGLWGITLDLTGKVWLVIKGMNVPLQMTKLSWEYIQSLPYIYNDGNVFSGTLIAGTEAIVIGTSLFSVGKAYKQLYVAGDRRIGKFVMNVGKSLKPFSPEWKSVVRTMFLDNVAVNKFKEAAHAFDIAYFRGQTAAMLEELNKSHPSFEKIRTLAFDSRTSTSLKNFKDLKINLAGTAFDLEVGERMAKVQKYFEDIESKAGDVRPSVDDLKKFIKDANTELMNFKTWVSSFVERLLLIKQGKFTEAFSHMTQLDEFVAQADKQSSLLKNPMAHEIYLDPQKSLRTQLKPAYLTEAEPALKAERIAEVTRNIESMEIGIQARFESEVQAIVKEAQLQKIALDHPSVIEKLNALDSSLVIPFARKKQEALKLLFKEYETLPKTLRTPAMKSSLLRLIEGGEGRLLTHVVKGAQGRLKMMAVMGTLLFATDTLIHKDDPERDLAKMMTELGPDLKQMLLDILPVAGTFSLYYSAFTGRQLIATEHDVSGAWDRATNVIWGTVSLAGDALAVLTAVPTGGLSVDADVAIRLTKMAEEGSKPAKQLLRDWPRIQKIAEQMGGWKNFASKVAEYLKMDKAALVKNMRTFEKAGLVAGTAAIVGGIAVPHLYYGFVDSSAELEVPADLNS
jgi:hypothetical protein